MATRRTPPLFATMTIAAGALLCCMIVPARARQEEATLSLHPEAIEMDLFYYDGHVEVEGTLPAGTEAAIVLRGPDEAVEMSMKGRRLHLWMAVGTATFQGAPVFYRCLTSKPIAALATAGSALDAGLGYEALKRDMTVHFAEDVARTDDAHRDWKAEFIEYKQHIGLYEIDEGGLTITPSQDGRESVRGDILIPARAPGGAYQVTLIGFRDGKPVARATRSLPVSLVGAVAFLRDMAMQHGWLYGLMAVVIALAAGLGVGAIMPSKAGRRSRK